MQITNIRSRKKYLLLLGLLLVGRIGLTLAIRPDHVPGQYLVQLGEEWEVADWLEVVQDHCPYPARIHLERTLSEGLRIFLLAEADPQAYPDRQMLAWLRTVPGQVCVQYNHYLEQRAKPTVMPNDPSFTEQWFLENTGQNGGVVDADIDAPAAWDLARGDTNVWGDQLVVAVLDDGFALQHPDMNWWRNLNEIPDNEIDDDENGFVDDVLGWNVNTENGRLPDLAHGTLVSGVIAAKTDNDLGVSGVSFGAQVLPVAGIFGLEAEVVAAYDYVLRMRQIYEASGGKRGAYIVATNASFGKVRQDPNDFPLWCGMYDALGQWGILNVVATANDNYDVDLLGDVPSGCSSPWMIAVTSTDRNDRLVDQSAYGTTSIDLGAPGSQILTTHIAGLYDLASGTSYAAPMVAGVIPLMMGAACPAWLEEYQQAPADYTLALKDYLLQSVDPLPSLQNRVASGGRLNAARATEAMQQVCTTLPDSCLAPYRLTAVAEGANIRLSWQAQSLLKEYRLRYRPLGGGGWQDSLEVSGQSVFINDWAACTTYEWQVGLACANGSINFSTTQQLLTDGCCESHILSSEAGSQTLTITWEAVVGVEQFELDYRPSGTSAWQSQTVRGLQTTLTHLDSCTTYELRLRFECPQVGMVFADSVSLLTKGCGDCIDLDYCTSVATQSTFEWIRRVQIGEFVNESTNDAGYGDFTDQSMTLTRGDTLFVSLSPGYSGSSFTENWRIWVDENVDGVFSADEIIFSSIPQIGTVTDTLVLPDSMPAVATRMRVSMAWAGPAGNFAPQGCTSFVEGEVEDYCVALLVPADPPPVAVRLFPNPAKERLTIESPQPILSLEVITPRGRSWIPDASVRSPYRWALDVRALNPGVYYLGVVQEGNREVIPFVKY